MTYTDFIINKDNTFYIVESSSKPKIHGSTLETLKKIEFIIKNNLSYDKTHKDKYSNLSKKRLSAFLEEKSTQIHNKYEEKLKGPAGIFSREWFVRKLFGKEKQITRIFINLQIYFNPLPVLPLPNDTIRDLMSNFLTLEDVGILHQTSRHGKTEAHTIVIDRAKKYGYEGNNYAEASKYINLLIGNVKRVLADPNLQHRYILYQGKTIDLEITSAIARERAIAGKNGFKKMIIPKTVQEYVQAV